MRVSPTPPRTLVIGHRGASGYRPEHTRASYELALALGADAVAIGDEVGATGAYDELVIDRQHHDPVKRRGLTAAGTLGAVAPRLPVVVAPIGVRPGQFLTPEGATSFTAAHATRRGRLLRRED